MATHNQPPQTHIDELMHLLEDTGLDLLLDVLPAVLATRDDEQMLAWLPAEIVQAALTYLQQQKQEQDEAREDDDA
jgi:ATP adenylyltransferase/5',5'''-P-1,P-4-tetraphosphate phosphorylase II